MYIDVERRQMYGLFSLYIVLRYFY